VSSAAERAAGQHGPVDRLGITAGMVVQELGRDEDVDAELRATIAERCGSELVGEDFPEGVDAVLLWWRDGDGDLADALVDALTPLADEGMIWLLTPKAGRDGHVEPSEISQAAPTAGLSQTTTVSVAPDWSASRLAAPRARR
jgi:hypothetical protein